MLDHERKAVSNIVISPLGDLLGDETAHALLLCAGATPKKTTYPRLEFKIQEYIRKNKKND